jgi:DNA invertase Pin-like site-specific DNA recombinase
VRSEKVALYVRVSTLLNQDVNNQLHILRRFCSERGYTVVAEYSDEGVSGRTDKRPSLDLLISQARQKKFEIIIVAAIDRLGRSTKHLLGLLDEFHHLGISLISLRENIDFSTPYGQMALTMISAVAQLESELIRERIRVSLAVKKQLAQASGSDWRCGRPSISSDIEKQVRALRQQGHSIREIAKLLPGISKSSVAKIIKNTLSEKG